MSTDQIPVFDPHPRKQAAVGGTRISYAEVGAGSPIVFLHGNPTSSYLWRNIIPHLSGLGRCLAPDLIGMGASGKAPDGSYRFVDHARYLDAWFDALELRRDVTLVVHDWGSALGFHWARRHPEAVKGIAYMEAIVRPLAWSEFPASGAEIFRALRSPAGEDLVLQKNIFVERILPSSVMRGLRDEEMTVYRRPYLDAGESRRPMLTWPRQIPLDGEPAEVVAIVNNYSAWLATSPMPKLFINGEPGMIIAGAIREHCRKWSNQREVSVKGLHFLQEDSPHEIGEAIAAWLKNMPE